MAFTAPLLWLDGALVATRDATIPLMGHAPQRGSLVFDVASFHASSGGIAIFRAREHVARFMRSARIVGLTPRFHPMMPSVMADPGPYFANAGEAGVVAFFAIHILYGAIVGHGYGHVDAEREWAPGAQH